MDELIHTGVARTPSEALADARNATSPAETVRHLFLCCALQQQQIEELERAVVPGPNEGTIRDIAQRVVRHDDERRKRR